MFFSMTHTQGIFCDSDSDEEQLVQMTLQMIKYLHYPPWEKSDKFQETHFDKEIPSNYQAFSLGLIKHILRTGIL